jgi:hypothetical protein
MGTSGHVYRTKSLEYKTMKLMFCEAAVSLGGGLCVPKLAKKPPCELDNNPGSSRIIQDRRISGSWMKRSLYRTSLLVLITASDAVPLAAVGHLLWILVP